MAATPQALQRHALDTPSKDDLNFGTVRVKVIDIDSTPTGAEQDTGWRLPDRAVVLNAYVNVTTAEATGTTKTLDIGTDEGSNDPDGFLDGVSVASTGLVKGTLVSTGQTLGALLRVDESGAGVLVPEPNITSGGSKVTYTAGSNDFAEFRGQIIIVYIAVQN